MDGPGKTARVADLPVLAQKRLIALEEFAYVSEQFAIEDRNVDGGRHVLACRPSRPFLQQSVQAESSPGLSAVSTLACHNDPEHVNISPLV